MIWISWTNLTSKFERFIRNCKEVLFAVAIGLDLLSAIEQRFRESTLFLCLVQFSDIPLRDNDATMVPSLELATNKSTKGNTNKY